MIFKRRQDHHPRPIPARIAFFVFLVGSAAVGCASAGEQPAQAQQGALPPPVHASSAGHGEARTGGGADGGETDRADAAARGLALGEALGPTAINEATLRGDALEQLLARRLEQFWDVYDQARRAPTSTPAVAYPELRLVAAGEQLQISYAAIIDLADSGHAVSEPEVPVTSGPDANAGHRVRVDWLDDASAGVTSCTINDDVRYETASGAVIDDSVSTVLSSSTLAFSDGQWKVIHSRAVEFSAGISGCWLEDDGAFRY